MKVLLIAYECSPYYGSEWGVGWGRLLQAARVAETHVVTSAANAADLERARTEGLLPVNVHVHTPTLHRRWTRLLQSHGHFDYNYTAYRHWQRCAFRLAQRLHAVHGFDVAHQATVCTVREPGFAWKLGIPFVWGPFGGTQNYPSRMLPLLPLRHALYEVARSVANRMLLRGSPHVRAAAARATVLLGANSTNARDAARAFGRPVEQLLETALPDFPEPDRTRFLERVAAARRGEVAPPLRLLWSGQLHPRKALPVLLRALATLRHEVAFTLDVLGNGPETDAWQAEADRLGLRQSVRFHGWLPLPRAVAAMHNADVFCFTSLRDTSGNVVLEALAAGVPVIAFHHQGAADMVSPQSGILLPVTTPARAIADWANAIQTLAADPALLLRLSEGTTAQARRFLWAANGDRINMLYRQLAGKLSISAPPQCPDRNPGRHAMRETIG